MTRLGSAAQSMLPWSGRWVRELFSATSMGSALKISRRGQWRPLSSP